MNEIAKVEQVVTKPVLDKKIFPYYSFVVNKMCFLRYYERLIAETFISTFNYVACVDNCFRELKKVVTLKKVRAVLKKDEVRRYMYEKMEENGVSNSWTKEKWVKMISDHIFGKKKMEESEMYGMKLIGDMMGWKDNMGAINNNIQINFTQSDGTA